MAEIHECTICKRDFDLERGFVCPWCADNQMEQLARNRTGEYVDEVVRDLPEASVGQRLGEVMRRSKGAANPRQALDLLEAAARRTAP